MLWTEPNNAEKLVKVLAALGIDTVERITNVNNLTPFNGMLCMHYSCKETINWSLHVSEIFQLFWDHIQNSEAV